MSDETFAVLLAKPELLRDPRLAQTFVQHLKIPFADATRRVTTAWGIVGERLDESAALDLAAALKAAGIETKMCGENALPILPEAKPLASAAFGAESAKLFLKDATTQELRFADIGILAAAAWDKEILKTVKRTEGPTAGQKAATWGLRLATGLPLRVGPKEKVVEKVEKSSELRFALELVARDGARFHVDAEDFNYACLGPKMEYGAYPNFRLLVAALRERLPHAALSRGAAILLASQPVGTMGYDGPRDIERELRWLVAII